MYRSMFAAIALLVAWVPVQADIGASINSCVQALPASGGVCDFRGMGSNSTSTLITLNKAVTLLLDGTQITFTGSTGQIVVSANGVRIRGSAQSASSSQGTQLIQSTTVNSGGTLDTIAGSIVQDLEIRGVSFKGVGSGACGAQLPGSGVHLANTTLATIQNIRILENDFSNYCWHAVYIQGGNDILVANNSIANVGNGIRFSGVVRGKILNNNLRDELFPAEFGIAIGLDSTNSGYPICQDIQIANNSVGYLVSPPPTGTGPGYSGGEGIMVHAGTNVIISGNILNFALYGIGVNPYNNTDLISNVSVTGNSYFGPEATQAPNGSANNGIFVSGSSATTIPANVVIANNVIGQSNRAEAAYDPAGAAIAVGANNVIVTGNMIYNAYVNGIVLTNNNNELLLTNNYIYNVVGSASNGINGYTGTQTGRIRGNFVTSAVNGYNFCGMSNSQGLLFGTNDSSSVTTAVQCVGNVNETAY